MNNKLIQIASLLIAYSTVPVLHSADQPDPEVQAASAKSVQKHNISQAKVSTMTAKKMGDLLAKLNPAIRGQAGTWIFNMKGRSVLVMTDERADRMRIMSPIVDTNVLDKERLYRLLQANFDSAHDSRYAIAKGKLWSAFVHPLSSLSSTQFYSALNQVVTLAQNFGTTYSSGNHVFRHGDSGRILNKKTGKQKNP